jgi:hypothetical protein
MTVLQVLGRMFRHPYREIISQWNWKSAVLSGSMRGAIFFTANLTVSWDAAVQALLVDMTFRLPLVGVYGAMTQAFESAQPAWAATLCAMVLIPAVAHSIEFTVHWCAGTPALVASITASVAFSVISTVFNLFAMRRGVLIVGERSRPLGHDLRRMPDIAAQFLLVLPLAVWRILRGPGWSHRSTARLFDLYDEVTADDGLPGAGAR